MKFLNRRFRIDKRMYVMQHMINMRHSLPQVLAASSTDVFIRVLYNFMELKVYQWLLTIKLDGIAIFRGSLSLATSCWEDSNGEASWLL